MLSDRLLVLFTYECCFYFSCYLAEEMKGLSSAGINKDVRGNFYYTTFVIGGLREFASQSCQY